MKSKAISMILSMMLMGGLGTQNIITINNYADIRDKTGDNVAVETIEDKGITIEALFLGDICLGTSFGGSHRFQNIYNEKGAEYFFSGVQEEFKNKDLIVANLENVFTNNKNFQQGKIYTYKADPKYIDIIKKSGITYFGVVNNHMGDYLQSGFNDSIKNLDAKGIKWFGTNEIKSNSVELGDIIVDKKEIYEKDGFKIGLLAYNGFYESYATDSMIKRDMEFLKGEGADYIVALVHWGGQNTHEITPRQKSYGHHLIDMGVDLIIGGHPHAVQEIEIYKEKRIYYSLGDFLFVDRKTPRYADSLMVQLKLIKTFDGDIIEEFKNIPVFWGGNKTENIFRPVVNKDKEDIERVYKLIKQ